MNKERRKKLDDIFNRLDCLKGELEEIRDEEQEAYDNMPEGLQNSDKGELAQACIDNLDEVVETCDSALDSISNAKE